MTVREAIGLLEREGRVHRIPAVGTFVRQQAPTGGSPPPKTVALSMEDFTSPFEVSIARGVDAMCQELGLSVQIFDARSSWQVETRHLGRLPHSSTAGAIIFPTHYGENSAELVKLHDAGYPFVLVDRTVPGLPVDHVESDNEAGAYLATQCLVRNGYRRVLMVTDPPMVSTVAARLRGYEQALIDHHITPLPSWKVWINLTISHRGFEEGRRNAGGYDAAKFALEPLSAADFPLGIFACNDYVAWGVVEACRELGLRIPEDVGVICFDDSDIIRALTPPVTAVSQRGMQIGRSAVELLVRRLDPETRNLPPQHVRIPVDLVERSSVSRVSAV